MSKPVRLVVTCTKRKTRPAPEVLRLRSVHGDSVEERAEQWIERLSHTEAPRVAAGDLYSGDHWSVVRSTLTASRVPVQLWISSAGYGLIAATQEIAPYSATFSLGHPDSVARPGDPAIRDTFKRWWNRLAEWRGLDAGQARSLMEIARADPDAPLIVVGSETYLRAMRHDLEAAAEELGDPLHLVVFSAGTDRLPGLEDHLVAYDNRLSRVLGGGMMSLNVRVTREVLSRSEGLRAPEIRTFLDTLGHGLSAVSAPMRVPQSDDMVRAFLREELERDPSQRWSPLLRILRDGRNWACEQKRFKALYNEVRDALSI